LKIKNYQTMDININIILDKYYYNFRIFKKISKSTNKIKKLKFLSKITISNDYYKTKS